MASLSSSRRSQTSESNANRSAKIQNPRLRSTRRFGLSLSSGSNSFFLYSILFALCAAGVLLVVYTKLLLQDKIEQTSLSILEQNPTDQARFLSSGSTAKSDVKPLFECPTEKRPKPKSTGQRVICTVVKNEARFIKEWMVFNFKMGWNRIVIFDHGSTDGTQDIVKSFPSSMVELHDVSYVPLYSVFAMRTVQEESFTNCSIKFWHTAETIGIVDVDEFVIPAEPFWKGADPLWDAFRAMGAFNKENKTIATGVMVTDFGFNKYEETPKTLILRSNYVLRMPSNLDELQIFNRSFPTSPFLRKWTYWMTPQKTFYFPNGQPMPIRACTHHPCTLVKKPPFEWRPKRGPEAMNYNFLHYNHIRFRSYAETDAKARRNKAGLGIFGGKSVNRSMDDYAFAYFNLIYDDSLYRFANNVLPCLSFSKFEFEQP